MLMTVLLLGLAVNLEPTRIGLVPLLLARDRPLAQLLAFLLCNLAVSMGCGLVLLLAFRHVPFGTGQIDGYTVRRVIGLLALTVAALMALLWAARRRWQGHGTPLFRGGRASDRLGRVLAKGRSPLAAGLVGVGVALPSVDYLAVLTLIATSGASTPVQSLALVLFGLTGSLVVLLPLAGYVMAPAPTLRLVESFRLWLRSRSLIEYAALLAAVGVVLLLSGNE